MPRKASDQVTRPDSLDLTSLLMPCIAATALSLADFRMAVGCRREKSTPDVRLRPHVCAIRQENLSVAGELKRLGCFSW